MLKGKLTYILAALAVVYGAIGFFMGWIDASTAINIVWAGLATFGVRRAIS